SRHVNAARWGSLIADLLWRDETAINEQMTAIRLARQAGLAGEAGQAGEASQAEKLAAMRGQLGDLLFQAGRWGESSTPLLAGANGPDLERRRSFAVVAAALPFVRQFS